MWSSKKVVRTESMLDENKTYFSHMLSPFKKNKQQQQQNCSYSYNHNYGYNYDYNAQQRQQQQQDGGKQGLHYNYGKFDDEHEDIDAKAEQYIRKKHQKFQLSR